MFTIFLIIFLLAKISANEILEENTFGHHKSLEKF